MESEVPARETTTALNIGQPRRQNNGEHREIGGTSTAADPIRLGFEKLHARFDDMDRRVGNLERPSIVHNEGDDSDFDEADQEWEDYRRSDRRDKYFNDRFYNPRGRGRGHNNRGGRGDRLGERGYQGRGGRYPRSEDQGPRQNRRRDNWDPPTYRQDVWGEDDHYDERKPNNWDPPQHRGCYDRPPHDHSKGVKMDAPHFDGSDAANWISRVQYYFDHKMVPETHRLHYVVMLFDPPALEWIFNYRANNGFVTWPEFLEDVRHRFDPQTILD